MSEMTIQEACDELNRRKWRGRDDWLAHNRELSVSAQFVQSKYQKRVPFGARNDAIVYTPEEAIAIAQGWPATERISEIEAENAELRQQLADHQAVIAKQQTELIDANNAMVAALPVGAPDLPPLAVRIGYLASEYRRVLACNEEDAPAASGI